MGTVWLAENHDSGVLYNTAFVRAVRTVKSSIQFSFRSDADGIFRTELGWVTLVRDEGCSEAQLRAHCRDLAGIIGDYQSRHGGYLVFPKGTSSHWWTVIRLPGAILQDVPDVELA